MNVLPGAGTRVGRTVEIYLKVSLFLFSLTLQVARRERVPWSLRAMLNFHGIIPWLPVGGVGAGSFPRTATGGSRHPPWTDGTTLWLLKAWRPWTTSTRRTSSGSETPSWISRRTSTRTAPAADRRAPLQDARYVPSSMELYR